MNHWFANHGLWLGTFPLTAMAWLGSAWAIPTRSAGSWGGLLAETLVATGINGAAWWCQFWRTQAIAPPTAQEWLLVLAIANSLAVVGCRLYRQMAIASKVNVTDAPNRLPSSIDWLWRSGLQAAIVAAFNWLWGGAFGLYAR